MYTFCSRSSDATLKSKVAWCLSVCPHSLINKCSWYCYLATYSHLNHCIIALWLVLGCNLCTLHPSQTRQSLWQVDICCNVENVKAVIPSKEGMPPVKQQLVVVFKVHGNRWYQLFDYNSQRCSTLYSFPLHLHYKDLIWTRLFLLEVTPEHAVWRQ